MKYVFILFAQVFFVISLVAQKSTFEKTGTLNIHPDLIPSLNLKMAPFFHGVASGDPTQTSIIIWTRVTLDTVTKTANVNWELATDSLFTNVVKKGIAETNQNQDFTVKIDVENLQSHHRYYYRFIYKDSKSIVGKTETLTSDMSEVSIAFASCSNYEWGYFNNYRAIAMNTEVNMVVHLGDYIYEYGVGKYGDTSIGRLNVPAYEITSLADYRTRYSLYRLDTDLVKVHQEKPFITTWDDHESANNAYKDGAENHQSDEGLWLTRKNAAKKAYYEWLPVRETKTNRLYRAFEIGKLVNLIILDSRLEGRTSQVTMNSPAYQDSTRFILGKEQYAWLTNQLKKDHVWNIIGNQVLFGSLTLEENNKKEKYMDGWEGYPFERKRLIHFLEDQNKKNTVFVTGDFHNAFALETDLTGTKDTMDNIGVEFVVTSINSANDNEYNSETKTEEIKQDYLDNNPNLKYCNNKDHGYLVLKITKDKLRASYHYTSNIRNRLGLDSIEAIFEVDPKSAIIHKK